MDWGLFATVTASVAIAAGSWLIGARQARAAKRREKRVDYLIGAFEAICAGSVRAVIPGSQAARGLELAVDRIQLMGTETQIRLVEEFTTAFCQGGAPTEPLLLALRNDLRRELGLLDSVGDCAGFESTRLHQGTKKKGPCSVVPLHRTTVDAALSASRC